MNIPKNVSSYARIIIFIDTQFDKLIRTLIVNNPKHLQPRNNQQVKQNIVDIVTDGWIVVNFQALSNDYHSYIADQYLTIQYIASKENHSWFTLDVPQVIAYVIHQNASGQPQISEATPQLSLLIASNLTRGFPAFKKDFLLLTELN